LTNCLLYFFELKAEEEEFQYLNPRDRKRNTQKNGSTFQICHELHLPTPTVVDFVEATDPSRQEEGIQKVR
jgi:hypothetical protein